MSGWEGAVEPPHPAGHSGLTDGLMGGKVNSDIRDNTPSAESWALFLSKSIYQRTSAQPECSYPQSLVTLPVGLL